MIEQANLKYRAADVFGAQRRCWRSSAFLLFGAVSAGDAAASCGC